MRSPCATSIHIGSSPSNEYAKRMISAFSAYLYVPADLMSTSQKVSRSIDNCLFILYQGLPDKYIVLKIILQKFLQNNKTHFMFVTLRRVNGLVKIFAKTFAKLKTPN